MTDRQWAPCTAFDTGEVPVVGAEPSAGRRARAQRLSRQLEFERSRLQDLTATPEPARPAGPAGPVATQPASAANPVTQAYARRLRYRIGVLRLRLAAESLLATGAGTGTGTRAAF